MANTTPTVRCPECTHPINNHSTDANCRSCGENSQCRITPNTIAVALLFGDLTNPTVSIKRQPDGSWS